MRNADAGALTFAVDRLGHALQKPIRCGEIEWASEVGRALIGLRQALDRHAILVEAPTGLFARVADPSLLPFTAASREVADVRAQHAALRRATAILEQQLEAVLQMAKVLSPVTERWTDFQERREAGVFRALLTVARMGEQLLEGFHAHNAAEDELARSATEPPGMTDRQRRGTSKGAAALN